MMEASPGRAAGTRRGDERRDAEFDHMLYDAEAGGAGGGQDFAGEDVHEGVGVARAGGRVEPVDGGDHDHRHRARASHSCFVVAGRYCGPFLLFITLGAVLGGIIVRHSPDTSVSIADETLWAFDAACDKGLVHEYDKPRVVQTALCMDHATNKVRFARRLGGDSVNFLVIGDWGRDGMCCQRDVAVEMGLAALATEPLGVLNTGDNFYPFGIPSASHEQISTSWQEVYNVDGLHDVTWYSVLGNHDHYGSAQAELEMHHKFTNWHMPDRYYAQRFQVGAVSVEAVFLDTTPTLTAYTSTANVKNFWLENNTSAASYLATQIAFLEKTFASSTATWKIVVAHHPVYTSSEHYFEDHETLRKDLRPVLDKHKVAAYFNGHDHGLEEHAPADAASTFVLSGAGSQVRPDTVVRDTGFKFHAATQGGFVAMSANASALLLQYIDFSGALLRETVVSAA